MAYPPGMTTSHQPGLLPKPALVPEIWSATAECVESSYAGTALRSLQLRPSFLGVSDVFVRPVSQYLWRSRLVALSTTSMGQNVMAYREDLAFALKPPISVATTGSPSHLQTQSIGELGLGGHITAPISAVWALVSARATRPSNAPGVCFVLELRSSM